MITSPAPPQALICIITIQGKAEMNQVISTQLMFFDVLKKRLPANLSLVHELSELLGISYDSAYRRLRGEKDLSIEELRRLCIHYDISFDSLINIDHRHKVFNSIDLQGDSFNYYTKLSAIVKDVSKKVLDCQYKDVIFCTKEISLFHFIPFPELLAFKLFFWSRIQYRLSERQDRRFSTADDYSGLLGLNQEIYAYYLHIPKYEIWCNETLQCTLRQISYCWESGFFADVRDAIYLCELLEQLYSHLKIQAEAGYNFPYGSEHSGIDNSFSVYYNDVFLVDSTILINTDHRMTAYLTYNGLNLLATQDAEICLQIEQSLRNTMQSGVLISGTSAKERNHLFKGLIDDIRALKASLRG